VPQQSDAPDHQLYISQLKHIISEQRLGPEDFCPQFNVFNDRNTYSINRFLDEPADFKSLVVLAESSSELRRKAAHIVTVTKQTEDVDLLFDKNESPGIVKSYYTLV
jgi:hypothetical protein